MTVREVQALIGQLKRVFDIVRLVDVSMTAQYSISEDGELLRREPYECYMVWNKNGRCENCISAKAFAQKGKMTKFEFVNNEVYYVISMYLEMEPQPYMLEMVSRVTDETLFGAYGKNEFIQTILDYNRRLYIDPLTGVYNRQYYEEQLSGLASANAVAMLDVDNFKRINDTAGHMAGDAALRAIGGALLACMRRSDAVVRYGGDEFLLVFQQIAREEFAERLEAVREAVRMLSVPGYEQLRLSVSIGGAYSAGAQGLLGRADALLYKAKETKDRVETD